MPDFVALFRRLPNLFWDRMFIWSPTEGIPIIFFQYLTPKIQINQKIQIVTFVGIRVNGPRYIYTFQLATYAAEN